MINLNHEKIITVHYKPRDKKIYVGRLALKSRKIYFEYDLEFVNMGLNLSPFNLPFTTGVSTSNDLTFDGLFGVFNDSLPDGWGRLLLDRTLTKHNINPGALSMLDRLSFVGSHGMGALIYEPETNIPSITTGQSLDEIANEINNFQMDDNDSYVEDLLNLGGSSAGARPKILMNLENKKWLIKFPSSTDPEDIGAIEYAYYLMAKNAGLEVAKAKLFPSRKGPGFFGSVRFDRENNDNRIHMHTLSGLLHSDHRLPNLDYEMVMKVTMHLTRNIQESKKQFRQCVFNVLSHNRDDHSKNFSFLMDSTGQWSMSPSYDLTFSSGPQAEHCTMIMHEGKNPGLTHLLELARVCSIKKVDALNIIEEVKSSVMRWPEFSKKSGVRKTNIDLIHKTINKIILDGFK